MITVKTLVIVLSTYKYIYNLNWHVLQDTHVAYNSILVAFCFHSSSQQGGGDMTQIG